MSFCFPTILSKIPFQNDSFTSTRPLSLSPLQLLHMTLNMMLRDWLSHRLTTPKAVPKRGKNVWGQALSPLSKEHVNNPCSALSQSQIPRELAFLAVHKTMTVCTFLSHSQILIIPRHSYFSCVYITGVEGQIEKKQLSLLMHSDIRMDTKGILLVIWPTPSGTLEKLFPGVVSMGAAKLQMSTKMRFPINSQMSKRRKSLM